MNTVNHPSILTHISPSELIGRVAARTLEGQLNGDGTEGTARFIIDQLPPDQIAAVAHAIILNANLSDQVEMHLPRHLLEGYGLPATVLTDQRATYFRNSQCAKPALLIANTGDDESQSLQLITPIGAPQLTAQTEFWVEIASQGVAISDEHKLIWAKALAGLCDLNVCSLDRIAEYALQTRLMVGEEGLPIINALGAALPALKMPRDTNYFEAIPEKSTNWPSVWKQRFTAIDTKRSPFLRKQTPAQLLLNATDLGVAFAKVKEDVPEVNHPIIEAFIQAPSGWNEQSAALAACEWEDIAPLFDGLKREKLNLSQMTLLFYDDRDDLLEAAEIDYVRRLVVRRTSQPEEEDTQFYERHRNEMKEDRKLKSAWDKFIFGTPGETEDFVAGLALCLEPLFARDENSTNRRLRIRLDGKSKKDLKDLNVDAGAYFAARYKGLKALFGPKVKWDVGKLFEFPGQLEEWRKLPKFTPNTSSAKSALQLKFLLELEVDLRTGGSDTYMTQLVWKFDPNRVTAEFAPDWSRLNQHPLVICRATRKQNSTKGRFQAVNISDVSTLEAAYDRDRGSFVSAYKAANNIDSLWPKNLSKALAEGLLDADIGRELRDLWDEFRVSYCAAVKGFWEEGIACVHITEQAEHYGVLLTKLCRDAKGDRLRELLLRPLLQIGSVAVAGGPPTEIIAPWHPLRLAAMATKTARVANLMAHFLSAPEVRFGDTGRLFFRDLKEELEHPFYPEIVLGWDESKPELLGLSDVCGDYTLHESPLISEDGGDETGDNPLEAAKRVADLVDRYLTLHPHESANLSVVLFNCDSARLPQAVVDRISAMHDDEDDVRCQIVLRHRDKRKLRALYERIMDTSDSDPDAFNASEATRDFMARLRIGISADQTPPPNPKDGPPNDITFSQDVIARHAKIEWFHENAAPAARETLVPARWSRRRPAARDDMKSVVYLCCPAQTTEGWAYLTALTTFLKGDWDGVEEKRLLPARQLDFNDPQMRQIFDETHHLGNWVVNYDELLDRRQLINQQVRVIRYKQSSTQGRNLIISSTAPLGLLRSMVKSRIQKLTLGLTSEQENDLTEKFIAEANDISGDIVLRAAKRGHSASELMGVVLSRFLIRSEMAHFNGTAGHLGWYFLDDYATWLGQSEEQIADILMLCPTQDVEGNLQLSVVVSEAKYVDYSGLAAGSKTSRNQLRDTVKRINDALFGAPERLDRNLWLARLSDLILDGVQFPASAGINLADWRRAIRDGRCALWVRGYSHVFISGPSDSPECADFSPVTEMKDGYQETFSRAQVRDLVLKFGSETNPMPLRIANGDAAIWGAQVFRSPSNVNDIHRKSSVKPAVPIAVEPPADEVVTEEIIFLIQSENEIELDAENHSGQISGNSAISPDSDENSDPPARHWAYAGVGDVIDSRTPAQHESEAAQQWLSEVENRTKMALQSFGFQARLQSSSLTPNAALLKFQGTANLTVEGVSRKLSEFKTTHGLTIIAVQPEPGVVSLSVERPQREIVRLEDLWARWQPDIEGGNGELLIGTREDDGSLLFLSPQNNAPHTLIAGSTGSGKSVLMQNIILGLAATNTPAQVQMMLIDPKLGVDYFAFEDLPHLQGGIIDTQEVALSKLNELVVEMDARYRLFRDERTANITAYNRKVELSKQLPAIWLIHDEFAEWMMVDEYKQQVASIVGRLGVKARAAGIYLVFAAQRPDVNVMPPQLRANLGNRLILRVDGEGTSEIALGVKGAERLLGKGHLLAKLEGESNLIYAQVPFVSDDIMAGLVESIS